MPNRGDRGGARTRARIADVATRLFVQHGFDAVTVADVAAAAGVSKVTVFAHFERKEDLLLDQLPDAVTLVRAAIRERDDGVGVIDAVRTAALALADQRAALSGLGTGQEPFGRVVRDSPALVGRLRAFAYEIEAELAAELEADTDFTGDSELTAALLVAAYRTVAVDSFRRRLDGVPVDDVAVGHRHRLDAAFDAVARGLATHTS